MAATSTTDADAPTASPAAHALAEDEVVDDDIGQRLVDAAAEEFAQHGYEGARIQRIARRAGLSTGTIYNRYGGKAELLRAALRRHSAAQADHLAVALREQGRAGDVIAALGRDLLRTTPGPRARLLLEGLVAARRDPEVAAVLGDVLAGHAAPRARVVRRAVDAGELVDDLDPDAFLRFVQVLHLGAQLVEAADLPAIDADGWDRLVDRIVGALTADAPEGGP